MSTDANQIELLVREVLARMAQQTKSEPGKATTAMPPALPEDVLELMGNVISVQALEGKLKGIKTVRIRQQAVITPAARDVLRAAKVTLVRGFTNKASIVNDAKVDAGAGKERPAALALFAPDKLVEILKKQLCPRRALVALGDKEVEQIVNRLRTALSNGHRLGVVVAENSFELNMAVNRQGLRGVRIASWSDFQFALQEASPDVWVLDSRQLNFPAITNVCNRIYENGYWRSRKENR